MQNKKKLNRFLLSAFCLTVTLPVFATDTGAGPYEALQPCIDDQVFAVVRLDVEKLDVGAFVRRAGALAGKHGAPDVAKAIEDDLRKFENRAGAVLKDFQRAGGRDIFVVFSMYDFPYFFVAIPIHSPKDRTTLQQHVRKVVEKDFNIGDEAIHVSDRLILVGLERTIARLKTVSPVRSEALAAGFSACADKTLQVVLFPGPDQRRIFTEMMPRMPVEAGAGQPMTIGEDMRWAALGLDVPPSMSLSLTIQSPNAAGAERMLTFVKALYSLAGQQRAVRKRIPQIDQILSRLVPQRQGERLRLQVDSAAADTLVDDVVAPALVQTYAIATRMACGANMSGIGKALLIYSNDYSDELPPDLDTLIHKAEMPPKGLICPATGQTYIYRGAGLTTSAIPMMITAYEKAGNHGGEGRNVVFLDSHVEWVTDERFRKLVEEDNEYRRKKGLPVLPAE